MYLMDEYHKQCAELAAYPGRGTGTVFAFTYTVLGLVGEGGELADKLKKVLRGDRQHLHTDLALLGAHDQISLDPEFIAAAKKELGDVLWYVAMAARELGFSLDEIASSNLAKLRDRKARGVLKGSGDSR